MLMSCPECPSRVNVPPGNSKPVLHKCSGHGGMLLPMVPDGTRAKITLVEREDYIGKDDVQMHEGRPIMAAVVTRDEGEDRLVFAPTVVGGSS